MNIRRHLSRRNYAFAAAIIVALAAAAWLFPRRVEQLVSADGGQRWLPRHAPATREIAWRPPTSLGELLPPHDPPDQISHPCLTDGGATLYLTVRRGGGDADLYRSRYGDGRWQPAEPLTEWNTPWDEEGVAISPDGRELYFASNRRGGLGGSDLWVSRRRDRDSRWGLPKNLGPSVNSPQDDFDPALSADGGQLFLASTRGDGQTSDLWVARREPGGAWQPPASVAGANLSQTNERSPLLSADGAFLYFASDRPARSHEPKNFDIYRVRPNDSAASPPGNLGPGINTPANEFCPMVSADGFTLTYASDQAAEGQPGGLYRTTAGEVERVALWDTSHWQLVRAIWWQAAAMTLLVVGLVAAFVSLRGWLWQRASLARFLVASLLVHALIVWLMILVPLSQAIMHRLDEIRVSQAATQLLDDNLHQSHEPGNEAYEKVADLQSTQPSPPAEVERRVTEPQNMPMHTDLPVPTLPAELARRLPADRLIFVPPPRTTIAASELERKLAQATRTAEIEPLEIELPPPVDGPDEQTLEKQVELARSKIEMAALPLPDGDVLDDVGGPRRLSEPKVVIGTRADKAVEAPPSLSPLASRLDRRPARATPVAYAEDNVGMQAMFALRQGDTRREFIELVGGNQQTEDAVRRGLAWLAEHQHADGRWDLRQLDPPEKKLPATSGAGNMQSDAAATGLALLPFLGAGHTHTAGDYQPTVGRGIQWLIQHQKPDGNLYTDPPSLAYMYSHGIATIALCEAYGLSQDASLREPAQRALNFIVAAQHQSTGGWRYQPGEPGDTSVVGWQVMALKSGEMAGLTVPQTSLDLAGKWLTQVGGTGGELGKFGYQGPSGTPAMSAEGLLCRQFLGARRDDPAIRAGADYLAKNPPREGQETSYYWYYATQVMYHMQGDRWTTWNEQIRDLLVRTQLKEGHTSGTWEPRDQWEQSGGRLYATSLRLLMLEVYYRHLPLYQPLD